MKQIYSDISPATGTHKGGICSIYIIPREWLAADPVIDFETGRVMITPNLLANKFWIRIDLVDKTYNYEEKPKSIKAGEYRQSALSGDINYNNYMLLQQLETLRRSQLVVLLTDRNKRRRLIGDTTIGMALAYSYSIKNEPGEERTSLELQIETEDPAPYYNPDGETEILYNLLENLDGNFLLVQ